jgi:hypothetical protein
MRRKQRKQQTTNNKTKKTTKQQQQNIALPPSLARYTRGEGDKERFGVGVGRGFLGSWGSCVCVLLLLLLLLLFVVVLSNCAQYYLLD